MADLSFAVTNGSGRSGMMTPFPVHPHSSGRYLVDHVGTPFPILGRVCWMITRLSQAAYEAVLDDTVAKGFNAIECKPPLAPSGFQYDSNGNLPFIKNLAGGNWDGTVIPYSDINNQAPDFTTPNELYWLRIDTFYKQCERRGLLCLSFPAYVGYDNTDWWMTMMVANGATKMQTYGAWYANRYQGQRNLIFMLGGDKGTGGIPFSGPETAVETALITGLKSVVTESKEYASEWLRASISKDLFASSITMNGCYADTLDINNQGARAWAMNPPVPAFYQEYPFEEIATGIIRRMTMWAWLSTIGGYLFGNGVFTDFDSPTYLSHMNTQATLDAQRLNTLVRTLSWWLFSPDNAAISAGGGTINTETQVAVASASDGSLLLAYCPPSHSGTVTITMSRMRGATLSRWWDPTNGNFTADASGLSNSGTHAFTKPGNNSAGDADWLLVLTA